MEISDLTLLDLFSGYGGFHRGLHEAGFQFKKTYFSEKDKNAIASYRYNFPEAEYAGTVENIPGSGIRADIITFGSPCQGFSIAGKGAGVGHEGSGLIRYAVDIVAEQRPLVFIWENVKGVLTRAHRKDFWAVVQAFARIGGYRLEWQLLNTVWWLPQNRERIFLVGHLGGQPGCEVFPVGAGGAGADEAQGEAQGEGQWLRGNDKRSVANTLTNRYYKDGSECLIRHSSENKLLRRQNKNDGAVESDVAPSLRASGGTDIRKRPVILQRARGANKGGEHENCPTISANSFHHNNHVVEATKGNTQGARISADDGIAPTLRSGSQSSGNMSPIILQTNKAGQTFQKQEAGTLRSGASANYQVIQVNPSTESHGQQPFQQNRVYDASGVAPALQGQLPEGGHKIQEEEKRIRRLTPIECERLQGLPDNWTKYGIFLERPTRADLLFREQNPELWAYHTKAVSAENITMREISDTQRYKMCGNGISIPPIKEIGIKLLRNLAKR